MRACDDAVDVDATVSGDGSRQMHMLGDIATAVLKSQVKRQENLAPFPGKIYLPSQYFRLRSKAKG